MREFELVIDDALKVGLSPLLITPVNMQVLYQCLGWRVGKGGLEPYEQKENPLPLIIGTQLYFSWPFPQVIAGEGYNFLIIRDDEVNHEDVIYSISDDGQTVNYLQSVDVLTYGSYGTLMEVADFGEYAIMMNGVVMVYWNVLGAWNVSTETATVPLMTTVCNFKGQVVGGGVQSAWHDCDETFYCWSKIGDLDFTPDNYNEAGYRRDPFGGTVLHTRRLNDDVIGYSSKGITRIYPTSTPAATMGFEELDDTGLINQGAMAAGKDRHVYVGEDYVLRTVGNVGQLSYRTGVTELGYEYYMRQLVNNSIIITYDKSKNDFYISDGVKTFLLSPNGMSEIPQHPSAVWRRNGETFMLPDDIDDTFKSEITSNAFDMGFGGQKTVFTIESDIVNSKAAKASVDNDFGKGFNTSKYSPLNYQGISSLIAAGNQFRIRLRADELSENARLSYIRARYKMTDMRGIRGVYAPPPRGQ